MNKATLYTQFSKVEAQEDGTAIVFGTVSSESLDGDNQITDIEWFRKASAEWSKLGNIREMHQPSAVGKGIELIDNGDSFELRAKIIDPLAAKKCIEGVYNGFSWGGKSLPGNPMRIIKDNGAAKGRIVGGAIVEISVVDNPANPDAVFQVVKSLDLDDGDADPRLDYLTLGIALVKAAQAGMQTTDAGPLDYIDKSVYASLNVTASGGGEAETFDEAMAHVLENLGLDLTELAEWRAMADASAALAAANDSLKSQVAELTKAAACSCGADCSGCMVDGACKGAGTAAGCPCEMGKGEDTEMEKAQLIELVKGLTADEKKDLGLTQDVVPEVTQEAFDALKSQVVELGKRAGNLGPSLRPALTMSPEDSTELEALKAEAASLEDVITKSMDASTKQFGKVRLDHIKSQIAELESGKPTATE